LTASPEELQLMLYDGAIKFAEEARHALIDDRLEDSHNALIRAQNIVLELSSGLNHEMDPGLCGKLASLYNFIYRRLVEANLNRDATAIDDALKVLTYQRETWVLLMNKLAEENQDASEHPTTPPQDEQTPSLSVSV